MIRITRYGRVFFLAPTFQVENEDFDLFLKSNLTMMWKYANDQANIDAITRSNIVHAMTKFPMDQHEIHMLPNQEELLKKDGVKEKDEEEESLPTANIPGYYWISLLKKVNIIVIFYQNESQFGPDQFILVVTKSLWSSPNKFGPTKTILDRPKLFWSDRRTRH